MKLFVKFFAALSAILLLFTAAAAAEGVAVIPENPTRVMDGAGLLSEDEQTELRTRLDEMSARHNCDIVVATVDSTNGATPMAYADDLFDYAGFGLGDDRTGILLLISMEERDWWISTRGGAIRILTDDRIQSIGDDIVDDLGSGDYAAAFSTFADDCERYCMLYGDYDDYGGDGDGSHDGIGSKLAYFARIFPYVMPWYWIPLSLLIGFLIACIAVSVMKGKLRSVRYQPAAGSYVRPGSFAVTASRDQYLYRTVSRTERPKDTDSGSSSTHSSSSGASHGGGGGKF